MEEAAGDPKMGEKCFTTTMNTTALSWETVNSCAQNEANDVQAAGAKATPQHDCKFLLFLLKKIIK
jgi:hypothetical protein